MGRWGGSHLVLEVFDDLDEVRALLGQRAVLLGQHLVLHLHLPRGVGLRQSMYMYR